MIFDDLQQNVTEIINTLDEIAVQAMVDNQDQIIDLNISQIEEGLAADGGIIGEYASDEYAHLKQSIGSKAPLGVVDMKLSGDYLEGFYGEPYISNTPGASGLFVDSTDYKADSLQSRYPGTIGIMPSNRDILADILIEPIQKKIIDVLTK